MAPTTRLTDWIACTDEPLPVSEAMSWVVLPRCGAVVSFVGTVRDHAEGRNDVTAVEYEAYREQVEPKLAAVAESARRRWSDLGRLVLIHRVGHLAVGEASVLVVASTAHRADAFAAAQFCIDTLKRTVPIWKREHWAGGSDWGTGAQPVADVAEIDAPPATSAGGPTNSRHRTPETAR